MIHAHSSIAIGTPQLARARQSRTVATAVHRCELVDHGEAGDDFSAEAQAGTQTAQGQHSHVRGECAEEGEAAKQQQVIW